MNSEAMKIMMTPSQIELIHKDGSVIRIKNNNGNIGMILSKKI